MTTGHLKVTRRGRWARCGEVPLGGAVGSGGVCSVAAGGRPRLSGWATGTSGGEVQAFSLRVETVSWSIRISVRFWMPTHWIQSQVRYSPPTFRPGRLTVPRHACRPLSLVRFSRHRRRRNRNSESETQCFSLL
ncbi:MAG: hypothetical protein ACK559_32145 [bacterium]